MTPEFALRSTNSWVGLTGNARVIANTARRDADVSYYMCSGRVQSELCVPILREVAAPTPGPGPAAAGAPLWQVIGIIDLESWNAEHFSPRIVRETLKVAFDLGANNLMS